MMYAMPASSLEVLFGTCPQTAAFSSLLRSCAVRKNIKVRSANGGTDIKKLKLKPFLSQDYITRIDMSWDHDSPIDNILTIPLESSVQKSGFLVVFIDSKFSADVGTTLNFVRDIEPKIQGFKELGFLTKKDLPNRVLVIASNRTLPDQLGASLTGLQVPVAVCGQEQLPCLLSSALVPPKYAITCGH
jgi:hypothetical protein